MSSLKLDAVLNLSLGAITRGREAERELGRALGDAARRGVDRGLKQASKGSAKDFNKTFANLMRVGMRKNADDLRAVYKDISRQQKRDQSKLDDIKKRMQQTESTTLKNELRQRKQALEDSIKKQAKAQKKLLAEADKKAKRRLDLIQAHEKRMNRDRLTVAKESGKKFQNLVEKGLDLGNMDPKALTEGLLKGIQGGLEGRAGAAGAAGKTGQMAKLAGAASTLASVAAPMAAVVAIIAAAYGQTKELNKSIMENVSAADLGTGSIKALGAEYEGVNLRLKMLRRTAISLASEFRMTKEEIVGAIGALNESGLTVREFRSVVTGATSDMQAYAQVTRTAVLASQGLGISVSETGDFMNKLSRDMGANLTDIQGAFGMIFSEASKAGMSTKDFFSAINQATSGMALYNFRIGDTVGLFTDLVEILGEDLAKERIGLQGTFAGMGMQERYKSAMLGGSAMKQAAQGDAKRQAAEFAEALASKGISLGGGIQGAGGGINMQRLASMGGKDFRAQLSRLQGQDPQLARQMYTLRGASQSMRGGTGGVAASLGSLSKLGELSAQMAQGSTMLGGRTLEEANMSPIMRMMAEEVTGMSGDQFDQLARIQTAMLGEFEALVALDDPTVQGKTFYEAVSDGTLSQTEQLEDLANTQYDLMERAAQDQLTETRSIGQTISNVIAGLLENIWLGLEHLITVISQSRLFGGSSVLGERRSSIQNEAAQRGILDTLGRDIAAKRTELTAEDSPERRDALRAELAALEGKAGTARGKMEQEQEFRRRLGTGGGDPNAIRKGIATERFEERFGMSPEDYQKQSLGSLGSYGRSLGSGDMSTDEFSAMSGIDINMEEVKDLTLEQIEAITAQAEETRKAEEELSGNQVESTDATTDAVEQLLGMMEREQLAKLTGATGMTPERLQKLMQQGDSGKGQIMDSLASAVGMDDITKVQAREYAGLLGLSMGGRLNDFIYRGDGAQGTVHPINNKDVIGTLRDGSGPLAQGGGGGGVNIYINGGDEARVYQVVKKVLQESGYGDMRSY